MTEPTDQLTDIQFAILDAMADDAENIEQIYLDANSEYINGERPNIKYLLHTLIDEIVCLLKGGYVEPQYSHNEKIAPLSSVNLSALHYYWFSPTDKGRAAWQAHG